MPPSQLLAPPDEDTFTVPASWRRHPRRGEAQSLKADRAVAWRLVDEVRDRVDALLAGGGGTDERAYLESGGAQGGPFGAAVIATAVDRYLTEGEGWRRAGQLAAFVDTWVADRGLDFAVRAVVEFEQVSIGWQGNPMAPSYYVTPIDAGLKGERAVEVGPIPARMRAHLAAAAEPAYRNAVDALAELQETDPLLAAFLVPERADWVAAAVSHGWSAMLLCAVGSADLVNANVRRIKVHMVTRQPATLPTLVAATGPAVAPALAHWLDLGHAMADGQKRLLTMLAALPTDEAFDILVRRLDRKYVRQAVSEAVTRFPARAARLLAEAGSAAAADLLRILQAGDQEPETTHGTLPALLAEPPWTRKKTTAKPVVIDDLEPDEDVTVCWQPGEQQAWAANRGWTPEVGHREWDDLFAQFLTGSLPDYLEAGIFGAGPEKHVRTLLPNWRPEPSWRVDGWLQSLAARYEQDALPLALHAADLSPGTNTAVLPPVVLRDGGPLPADAVRHVVTMLAMSRPGEVYAGVDVLIGLCTPDSLAEFAWGLFQSWQNAGMPAKDGWALDALGWLGDDETVRRLAPVIRAWPGDGGHAKAVTGLDVLAAIGTDVALTHLYGISQKVKFKALKAKAQEKIDAVAAGLGLSADQLGDRLVPDLGLDEGGSLTLDYGRRRFVVGFDEALRPYVADEDGTRRKDLPKPTASDDQDLAPAAYARFTALKKDARTIATDQVRRFELAMVSERRWPLTEFTDLFVAHPLLWHIVRRLVWLSGDTAFRVAEDRTFAGVEDDTLVLPDSASVGIAHPLHLALPAWTELFADYEILQPFPQLARPVHTLTADERTATSLSRFEQVTLPTVTLLGLTRRGWQRATPRDNGVEPWLLRPLPGNRAVVMNLAPGITVGAVDAFPEQRIEHVWLSGSGDGDWSPRPGPCFGELSRVTASEVLAELTSVT